MVSAEILKVREFMDKEYEKVEVGTPISSVLGKLRNRDVQEAVVVDGKTPVGVISYDIIIKRGHIPAYAKVENLMSVPPSLSPENNFIEACEALLSSGLRIIPVEEKKKIVGVVTRRSIMRAVPDIDEVASLKAEDVMSEDPVVVHEDDDIMKVRDIMNRYDIKAVPVVNDGGELIGVVGVKDIVGFLVREKERTSMGDYAGRKERVEIPVKSVMHEHPIFVGPGATLGEIAKLMVEHKIGGIIITRGKKPVGIVHQIDIIETGANLAPRQGVYIQISGVDEIAEMSDEIYDMIEKYMKRIAEMSMPRMLNMHVVHHHDHDGTNYTVRLRMATDKKTYFASFTEWNIFRALLEALEDLERQVKKDKERALDEKRRKHKA
jgi:CBS domain-containing protein/ribosome-associated translation inhibitor RaiA